MSETIKKRVNRVLQSFVVPSKDELWFDANDSFRAQIFKREKKQIFIFNVEELGVAEGEKQVISQGGVAAGNEGWRLLEHKYGVNVNKIQRQSYNLADVFFLFGQPVRQQDIRLFFGKKSLLEGRLKTEIESIKRAQTAEAKEALNFVGRFKYEKLEKYPHMKPGDIAIWEEFLRKNTKEYEKVDYDYALGIGMAGLQDDPTNDARGFRKLKKLKADVIAYRTDGSVDVIEVKPVAGTSAFGQVVVYGILFNQDWPNLKITPVIMTKIFHDDIKNIADRLGIKIIVV